MPGASCRLEPILLFEPHLSNVCHIFISRMSFLQVDLRWHQKIGDWNSYEHIDQATGLLVGFIGQMSQRGWSAEQALKGLSAEQRDPTVRCLFALMCDFPRQGGSQPTTWALVQSIPTQQWMKTPPVRTTPMMLLPEHSGTKII